MSLQPKLAVDGLFYQDSACSIGMTGTINDQVSMSAVSDGSMANTTVTYKPNSNVDV